ncbi:lipoprotein [Orbaceae bacterium ESL0721]|nr:lipoprotein [Orbaceae bacterium ESL0721]
MSISLSIRKYIKVSAAILVVSLLSACGLKGPLYPPSETDSFTSLSIDNLSTNDFQPLLIAAR